MKYIRWGRVHSAIMLYFLSLCLLATHSFAQESLTFSFDPISSEQELPHYTTHHIMQDSFGFIWISTRNGLCRFDGNTCTVFRKDSNKEIKLEGNLIWLTFEDSRNRLWIGTKGGGLSYYNPFTNTSEVYRTDSSDSLSISHDIVTSFYEDSKGNIWVGTDGGGLNRVIEKGKDSFEFKRIELLENKIDDLAILDILEDKEGRIWLATYGYGVFVYDPDNGKVDIINTSSDGPKLLDDFVMTLAKEDSIIWVGTKFGGIAKINLQNNQASYFESDPGNPKSLPDNFVWDIYIDDKGDKWIGTYGGGLAKLYQGEKEFHLISEKKEEGFTDNFILHTMEDRQGQMWVATDSQGIFRFKTNSIFEPIIVNWQGIRSSSNLIINDLFLDSKNQFWISTNAGLFTANSDFSNVSKKSTALGTTIFYQVKEGKDGMIWIASNNNVGFYNPETGIWGEIDLSGILDVPGTDRFFDIEFGKNGVLWLATDGGVIRYNPENQEVKLLKHVEGDSTSISGNKVGNLHMYGNMLWVGIDDRGVNVIDTATLEARKIDFSSYLSSDNISEYITDITEDAEGNILIGTGGKGVYCIIHSASAEIDSIVHITSGQSQESAEVFDIVPYKDFILLSLREGLAKLDKDKFSPLYLKLPKSMSSAGAKGLFLHDDMIYLFSRDQIFRVISNNIADTQELPEIQITQLEIYNEPLESESALYLLDELNLKYDQDFITLSYSSLNYDPNTNYPTEYILEGHDPYWLEGQESESINYTNLEPGEYTFKVRFADLEMQKNQLTIPIVIEHPFWETAWFRLIGALFIFGFLYMAYKYRTYYLLREERTRTRIARDLHDDLSGTLSSISFFSEAAQRVQTEPEKSKRFLEMIDKSATEAKEKINDIIWAIDPSKDDWSVFLKKCKRFAADALDSKEIEYDLNIAETFKVPIRLELRQNLWLIFKEMINNLAEHSQASSATVNFIEEDSNIFLEVIDDGIGFDQNVENNRNGINNIRKRAELVGATVELKSAKGSGTTWIFCLEV